MEQLWIIKIGGNVVDDPAVLTPLLAALAAHAGPLVLVHGGGKLATRLASQLGVPQTMVDGRRITDAATLDIAVMVYAGLANKQLVAGLQAAGRNAIGLSGADGNAISATKRPATPVDFGHVGDLHPGSVNVALFSSLLANGLTPVCCAITYDGAGGLLNTNADTLASALAVALCGHYHTHLLYLFEKKGVLRDIADEATLIESIALADVEGLIAEGTIAGGMIPKIRNAADAVRAGVASVSIGQPAVLASILNQQLDACTNVHA